MDIFQQLRQDVVGIIENLGRDGQITQNLDTAHMTIESTRDLTHGDVACNAAMVLAKQAGVAPRQLAEIIIEALKKHPDVVSAECAGPGFINIRLYPVVWQRLLEHVVRVGGEYGQSHTGNKQTINVEWVSANPTGPMHIGHARGAVFGDALVRLLSKAGYHVVREYYINDAGSQVETLARSAFLRYKEALGETIEIPGGLYPGEYLKPIGAALASAYGKELLGMEESQWLPVIKPFAIDKMMELIRSDLKDLGIEHDIFSSEQALHDQHKMDEVKAILEDKGLLYKGVLEPPKGKLPDDWEPRDQVLFKSTQFGDDMDRPLQKSDGSWTYFASDIAYHLDKIQRGYNHMILELGSDHKGYVKRMKAAVSALSDQKAILEVKTHDLVNFLEDGIPVKMSKRAGKFATVRDVIDAVGKDIVRFVMLTRKNDVVLDFDLVKVQEQSKDNPVFYVHYAHARAASVLRLAQHQCPDALKDMKQNIHDVAARVQDEDYLSVIKQIASFPRLVEQAAKAYEPHRVAFYLQELAASFHALWNKGKEDNALRFILEDNPVKTAAHLAVVQAVKVTIASGLGILNVTPLEEMV